MDAFIARQPIFDKSMNIYGYELLYRQSGNNYFTGIDDDQATAELIYNAFLVMGLQDLTDGANAFINFSKELIDSDVPFLLPKQNIVVEVLEREKVTPATVDACKRIKAMGYRLALDDFVFNQDNLPLIEMADIIKIEFPAVSRYDQNSLIQRYRTNVKFLAEKIETREEYIQASEMGYDLFQGYFFSKPSIVRSKEVAMLNTNLFSILEELNSPEPSYEIIATIIERDLGLSYKLLKLANSVYIGARSKIKSIPHALSYIGINEMYQWISLMMLKDMQNVENAELIKQSLIRGKLMELLASELYPNGENSEFYFTGIFSSIEVLLNSQIEQVLKGLPLSINVKNALLGKDNEQRRLLNFVLNWEKAHWEKIADQYPMKNEFMKLYLETLKWAKKLNY
ncbi:EAL and HDOD domain-containing protein [Desulfosporosinus youngiae]|uniref:Putative signal transduction protein containing EAL and modified HD-GYP domains n=1 Tax=Desulfosporosinus youngiae DSM 17734 TaxID=768710 RepID=H5Y133_9FIRM|nr:HDOD domain-containing protein [Desulfosporosinus youngiae]EHQ87253.1 putative signal transduction protein containing EAL and modified HD-GYP domains [Desulfosporosinus youngiae DSM 17734]